MIVTALVSYCQLHVSVQSAKKQTVQGARIKNVNERCLSSLTTLHSAGPAHDF
jgi:hypothetical protein